MTMTRIKRAGKVAAIGLLYVALSGGAALAQNNADLEVDNKSFTGMTNSFTNVVKDGRTYFENFFGAAKETGSNLVDDGKVIFNRVKKQVQDAIN